MFHGFDSLEQRRMFSSVALTGRGSLIITGGAGNDRIVITRNESGDIRTIVDGTVTDNLASHVRRVSVMGADGDDRITNRTGIHSSLDGGAGDDTIIGGGGNDALNGEVGDDLLDGGKGADDIVGGEGFDAVDYSMRSAPLDVSLDNVANDGEANEGDNVHNDVEGILGGSGNDYLAGDAWANYLAGNAGNDVLYGGDGNDTLAGGGGKDYLLGRGGNDLLEGRGGSTDTLEGDIGFDTASRDPFDIVTSVNKFIP
jgi:Ca2+-binding RTX toxin-like protein